MIILKQQENKRIYDVLWSENEVNLGTFEQDVDGYFYYWPKEKPGSWASYSLRLIADELDKINKEWDEEIKKYFDEQNKSEQITN